MARSLASPLFIKFCLGSSFFSSILAVEEVARVDPSVAILVDIHNTLITTVIMQHGNEEQKKYWLPKLVSDTVGSFCLSEATSGSDAFAMKTVAKPDGKGNYVINGTKLWIRYLYLAIYSIQ